jgi:hypothetical protein
MDVTKFHKAYEYFRQGDMAITTVNNEIVFSFRIPAAGHHIYFMSDHA